MNGFVPNHLRGFSRGDLEGNIAVKMGEVYERIGPNDDRNLNKKFDEYRVNVEDHFEGFPFTRMIDNCTLISVFGGLADKEHYSLRGEKAASTKKGIGKGSKVLVVCAGGSYKNAFIIGGIRDFQDTKDDQDKFKGRHYYWIFNGIEIYINDDGEYTLTYKGKTENDGKRDSNVSESSVGSLFSMLKDGKIKQIAIKEWRVEVSDGKAIIKPKDGLEIGEATDHMLLGESFRQEQSKLNKQLTQLLQQAGTQLSSAVSTAPGAALPQVQAAGALLITAAKMIDAFESAASAKNSFLSRLHKND